MPAEILDGRALAQQFRRQLAEDVAVFTSQSGIVPGLTVVLVGDDPASQVYVRNKQSATKAAGMNGSVLRLPTTTTQAELLARIDQLNADTAVHGILVQLPLPKQIDEAAVVARVDPPKDVDGFHPFNFGLLASGITQVRAVYAPGHSRAIDPLPCGDSGPHAVVLGRSQIVGKPMAFLLLQKGPGGDATVTVCHTGTRDPAGVARRPIS